jgi:hypothetical protein
MSFIRSILCIWACGLCQAQTNSPQAKLGLKDVPFQVKLLSPIDTRTAQAQNTFTASVDVPSQFNGAIIEGRINHVQRPSRGKGKAEIDFAFETVTFNGGTFPISANLDDIKNSRGVSNVDDEGRAFGNSSSRKKIGGAAGGAVTGAIVGGLLRGTGGAVAGGAGGALAGYFIAAKLTSSGSDIRLAPGTTFSLRVSDSARSAVR